MKKIIALFVAAMLCNACDPYLGINHELFWYVKNTTDKPVKISMEPMKIALDGAEDEIAPGDSLLIDKYYPTAILDVYFEMFYRLEDNGGDYRKRYFSVLSEDDEILKTWEYAEKNEPGKQFFNGRAWRHYVQPLYSGKIKENDFTWVFDILPQDVAAEQ